MESIINDYISRELVQAPAQLPLSDDASLLESGILDSLSLLQLVVFLEERFGITVGDTDLLPANFASVQTICAYLRAREPQKEAPRVADEGGPGGGRVGRLARTAERAAYWIVVAPVLALLPAALGYRVACWRGDWLCRQQSAKRAELARNFRLLGSSLTPAAEQAAIRDWFRASSCEAVDVARLRLPGARPLRRLIQIQGREHLEAALAAGKGAVLCSAHFGSYDCAFSMLGPSGFPVTTIGRWQHKYTAGMSGAERRFWEIAYARPLQRRRHRPNIEPWPGRFEVAAKAASVLRAGEVVTISIDVPPLDSDKARAIEVPFLGGRASLLPGVVTLAKLTGAPVLTCFMYRSGDYRHQVLEISAPVPMDGNVATAFGRCAAGVSAAITKSPSHWAYFASSGDLATLGLVPAVPGEATSPAGVAPGAKVVAGAKAAAGAAADLVASAEVIAGSESAADAGAVGPT